MRIPILKQENFLIASVQSAPTDIEWENLRDNLAAEVGRDKSKGVIIDISPLDVMDSFATRTLRSIAYILSLRGATTMVVGIQADVAYSMVRLGLSLQHIKTALDLEDGLTILREAIERGADSA